MGDREKLVQMHRTMVEIRTFEETVREMFQAEMRDGHENMRFSIRMEYRGLRCRQIRFYGEDAKPGNGRQFSVVGQEDGGLREEGGGELEGFRRLHGVRHCVSIRASGETLARSGSCVSGETLGFRRSLSVRRASRLRCLWPPQRSGGALPGHSGRDPCRCRSSLAGRRARRSPAGGRL